MTNRLMDVLRRVPEPMDMEFAFDSRLTDSALKQLGDAKIRRLELTGCDSVTDVGIWHISAFPRLEELTLRSLKVTDGSMKHLRSLGLRKLALDGCFHITDVGIFTLSQSGTLRETLRTFEVDHSEFTDDVIPLIAKFRNLQSLSLVRCRQLTGSNLGELRGLKHLKSVDLSEGKRITDAGGLSVLPELVSVKLYGCRSLGDKGLKGVLELKKLRELNLGGLKLASAEVVSKLSSISTIEHLVISGVANLTKLSWIKGAANLRVLEISYTSISDAAARDLAFCKKLERLDLSGCVNITDDGVNVISKLPGLKEVNLTGCTKISAAGLASIKRTGMKVFKWE